MLHPILLSLARLQPYRFIGFGQSEKSAVHYIAVCYYWAWLGKFFIGGCIKHVLLPMQLVVQMRR